MTRVYSSASMLFMSLTVALLVLGVLAATPSALYADDGEGGPYSPTCPSLVCGNQPGCVWMGGCPSQLACTGQPFCPKPPRCQCWPSGIASCGCGP
jgi:hypothetical protein